MDLQARKYAFIQELFKVEEPSIMYKLEQLLKREIDSEPDTVAQYNADLDTAIKEIEDGEFYTQKGARKIAQQW